MAEGGNKDNNSSLQKYRNKRNEKSDESGGSDAEEANVPSRPDLFNENILNIERKASGENLISNQNELPRREENPFSFKHFLNRDIPSSSNVNCQTGARPKIFSSNRQHSLPAAVSNSNFQNPITNTEPVRMSSVDNVRSEYPSVLPDFVQDHLVIEQCYLSLDDSIKADIDNLPDFTLNRPSEKQSQWSNLNNSISNDSNTDLTFNLTSRRRTPRVVDFPLDLPLSSDVTNHIEDSVTGSGSRSCPQSGEVGVSKSLPDFLSDGPIHSNRISNSSLAKANEQIQDSDNVLQRDVERSDNERLREEIHLLRQQLHEKDIRIQNLELDMNAIQRQEKSYIDALSKSMDQVEGNLNSSAKRVISTKTTVSKMKQEIKNLKSEVSHLRKENALLREHNLGAVGGASSSSSIGPGPTRRIAQDLRGAANNAEHLLRNLLTGLNNLRVIADSVENMHRVEERQEFNLSDLEDEPGPAL